MVIGTATNSLFPLLGVPAESAVVFFTSCCLPIYAPIALMATRGMTLYHTKGESNPYKTILTEQEFCGILTDLRENYEHRNKTQEFITKSVQYEPEA